MRILKMIWASLFIIFCCVFGAQSSEDDCNWVDNVCLNSWEMANYEAVRTLHTHLDDDQNGDIDLSESVEFLKEELNYTKGFEKRQEAFHPNNDQHISLKELWEMWVTSEVHNWTVENTVSWLCLSVDLSQYSEAFYAQSVNGSFLPRLATNNDQYLAKTLGIKNSAHRSKIAIKAMDVVLFGPPKDAGNYLKDLTIVFLITFLLIGAFRFYQVKKEFEQQRSRMIQKMELLHDEERQFREELQIRGTSGDGQNSEDTGSPSNEGHDKPDWSVGNEENGRGADGAPLQTWLQLSYEREKSSFDAKCQLVEAQLKEARNMCEKLQPSKKQFFAALGLVHGKTEPKYDAITEDVRESINEIKLMHKEMQYRWSNIEKLTGYEIMENAGLTHLELILEPDIHCPSKFSSTIGA